MGYQFPFREICDSDADIIEFDRKSGKHDAIGAIFFAVLFVAVGIGVPCWLYFTGEELGVLFCVMWVLASLFIAMLFVLSARKGVKTPQGICEARVIKKRISEDRDSDGDPIVRHYLRIEFNDGMSVESKVSAQEYKRAEPGSKVYLLKLASSKKDKVETRLVVPK